MLPYLCGGVVMNDPFALSLIFVVPLLSVYLVIKLIFTYIALSIDNHILLKVNVDAFMDKWRSVNKGNSADQNILQPHFFHH